MGVRSRDDVDPCWYHTLWYAEQIVELSLKTMTRCKGEDEELTKGGVERDICVILHFQEWVLLTAIIPPPIGFLRQSTRKVISSACIDIAVSSTGRGPSLTDLPLPDMMTGESWKL